MPSGAKNILQTLMTDASSHTRARRHLHSLRSARDSLVSAGRAASQYLKGVDGGTTMQDEQGE
jgi:hypothetical protein